DPVKGIIPLHRRIAHVHARDARKISVSRGAQEVALGAGDVDWLSFVASLVSVEYRGWLTIRRETGQDPLKDIERGVLFLRRALVPTGVSGRGRDDGPADRLEDLFQTGFIDALDRLGWIYPFSGPNVPLRPVVGGHCDV